MKSIAIAACWQQYQRPETVCVSGLWFRRQELLVKYIRSFEHDFRLFAGVDDDSLDESVEQFIGQVIVIDSRQSALLRTFCENNSFCSGSSQLFHFLLHQTFDGFFLKVTDLFGVLETLQTELPAFHLLIELYLPKIDTLPLLFQRANSVLNR
jgi:hypothetical protein